MIFKIFKTHADNPAWGFFIFVYLLEYIMATIEEIYKLFHRFPRITTDSRNVIPGSVFFGIKGEQFDGNLFAAEALGKGAAYAITDDPSAVTGDRCILVPDTMQALQQLAAIHRSRISARVIGVTGSNGKTTTKELIGKVLSSTYKTLITQGNLNNHIGVPLTLLSVKEDTDFAVVEMGANHPGEIEALCNIARPGFGIITNIGKAHLEGFGSFEGVIKAKSELYNFIRQSEGAVFVNLDNQLLLLLSDGMNIYSYGSVENAACRGEIAESDPALAVTWHAGQQSGFARTRLYGDYNFENVMAAVAIGLYFGVSPEKIDMAISSYQPENNRSQMTRTKHNVLLLDAYNANPSSMAAALNNFRNVAATSKMVILGDMMELGDHSMEEHREIVALVRQLSFSQVCFVGKQFSRAAKGGQELCFASLPQAEKWFRDHPVRNMNIMLKGSRKMMLEKLLYLL
jgi:UDP-N-acetylmuramoyl-tripeptide--D-alanyl-D-alanine ligase